MLESQRQSVSLHHIGSSLPSARLLHLSLSTTSTPHLAALDFPLAFPSLPREAFAPPLPTPPPPRLLRPRRVPPSLQGELAKFPYRQHSLPLQYRQAIAVLTLTDLQFIDLVR